MTIHDDTFLFIAGTLWMVAMVCGFGAFREALYWMRRCVRAEKVNAGLYELLGDHRIAGTSDDALWLSAEIARVEKEALGA